MEEETLMKRCIKCLMPETRPRIEFDDKGICNACNWHKIKQTQIDWDKKFLEFTSICNLFKNVGDSKWDCIVPVSGGKDSTFVADTLLSLGMNPLTVSFSPQIQSSLDRRNWENFVATGFDNILITPNSKQYRRYAKEWFIKMGLPRQPFVSGISTAIINLAKEKIINLVVFSENGEVDYGGGRKTSK